MDKSLTVKQLKKSEAEYNPRKITKLELDNLKKAIEKFGDLSGIVLNKRTGRLVGGHQRIKVVPPDAEVQITERYTTPTRTGTTAHGYIVISGEKYTYREVDWDEQTEKTANIAANAHGGDWDEEKLHALFTELSQMQNFDLDLTGFSTSDVYQVLGVDPFTESADHLAEIAADLRRSREKFKEMQKRLDEVNADTWDCYLVVIFKTHADRKKFTDLLNLPDNRYVDSREILNFIKK